MPVIRSLAFLGGILVGCAQFFQDIICHEFSEQVNDLVRGFFPLLDDRLRALLAEVYSHADFMSIVAFLDETNAFNQIYENCRIVSFESGPTHGAGGNRFGLGYEFLDDLFWSAENLNERRLAFHRSSCPA
jgi:hypothetical protein